MTSHAKIAIINSKPSTRHHWFALLIIYIIAFIGWIVLSKEIHSVNILSLTTRIDATISAWATKPFFDHWFMFFLTEEDANDGIPYSNMPYFYAIFYAAYHCAIDFVTLGKVSYASTYILTMTALLASSWYVLQPALEETSLARGALLLVLTSGMLVTSPYVVGYLLQFNHDTSFPLNAIAATILAFAVWRDSQRRNVVVWLALVYCSISGLLGLVTLACCYVGRERLKLTNTVWLALFAFNVAGLLLPMFVAKLVFDQTSASSLMFRTGLDGSTQYFTSHWQAFVDPVRPRSLSRALGVKFFSLGLLFLIARMRFGLTFIPEIKAFGVALLVYVSHLVMFPQSISIHPYLYDMLFLIPLDLLSVVVVGAVIGRFREISNDMGAVVAIAAVIFVLHSNLLQLAQGRFIAM